MQLHKPCNIYLAGPQVFRVNATAIGAYLKTLCAQLGFTGHFPIDGEGQTSHVKSAGAIFKSNIAMLEQADIVMADISNFRGAEPDSGTCFEIGYAAALAKPVYAYTVSGETMLERVGKIIPLHKTPDQRWIDNQGCLVEDFQLPANLMLSCAATIVTGDAEKCLMQIASDILSADRSLARKRLSVGIAGV